MAAGCAAAGCVAAGCVAAGSAAGGTALEDAGIGDICEVDAGAGCCDSTGCWAAALTEISRAVVNIHFEVLIALSLRVPLNQYRVELVASFNLLFGSHIQGHEANPDVLISTRRSHFSTPSETTRARSQLNPTAVRYEALV